MSPLLFNLYMHGAVRRVNARVLGKVWNCCGRVVAGLR